MAENHESCLREDDSVCVCNQTSGVTLEGLRPF